jgi:hypothetical protein
MAEFKYYLVEKGTNLISSEGCRELTKMSGNKQVVVLGIVLLLQITTKLAMRVIASSRIVPGM